MSATVGARTPESPDMASRLRTWAERNSWTLALLGLFAVILLVTYLIQPKYGAAQLQGLAVGAMPLAVQPNPFKKSFTITLPPNAVIADMALYDALGRRLALSTQRSGSAVLVQTTAELPSGLYILTAIVDGKPYTVKLTHY